jgi:ribosomal protein S18 acetylase RimI-like enzyme
MAIQIRPARPSDAPVIIEYNRRMAEETEGKALDRAVLTAGVERALADPAKGRYFVGEEDGEVLGQMMVTWEWSDWRNGWFWWIQSVYVRADARRKGVFKGLYDHVCRTAKETADVIGIRLYVDRDNQAAQKTYARLGMEVTEYLVMEQYPL